MGLHAAFGNIGVLTLPKSISYTVKEKAEDKSESGPLVNSKNNSVRFHMLRLVAIIQALASVINFTTMLVEEYVYTCFVSGIYNRVVAQHAKDRGDRHSIQSDGLSCL